MYDSTTAADIPANARIVAGYINGLYKWSPEDWTRFPAATQQVTISVTADETGALVLDIETGDATPAQAPGWVNKMRQLGFDPVVYCSLSNVNTVSAAFVAANTRQPKYWVADWTGTPHLVENSVATQYADPSTSGGHYDL